MPFERIYWSAIEKVGRDLSLVLARFGQDWMSNAGAEPKLEWARLQALPLHYVNVIMQQLHKRAK